MRPPQRSSGRRGAEAESARAGTIKERKRALAAVTEVTKENFAEQTGEGTVLIDVWGPQCAPCVALNPHVEGIAESRPELPPAAPAAAERDGSSAARRAQSA